MLIFYLIYLKIFNMLNLQTFFFQFLYFVKESLDLEVWSWAPIGHQTIMFIFPKFNLWFLLIDQFGQSLVFIKKLSIMSENHINFVLKLTHFFALGFQNINFLHQWGILLLQSSDEHFSRFNTSWPSRWPRDTSERTRWWSIHVF